MKINLIIIISLMTSFVSFSQDREYISKCGDSKIKIVWEESRLNAKIHLLTKQDSESNYYILDRLYRTEKWSQKDALRQTDFSIEYNNGKYYISGIFKGEDVSKIVKGKGYVWYQNIAYNAGSSLKREENIKFECFRPDNLKLFVMEAESMGQVEIEDKKQAHKVNVCLTGILANFWKCTYFFDTETDDFIMYKGVNGAPGTPETIIRLVQ